MSPPDFVSYAPHGEDVVLWRALGRRGGGVYVDVGACDPNEGSVTRALYEHGWHGVNIEPRPGRIAAFDAARPRDVNLAIAAGEDESETVVHAAPTAGSAPEGAAKVPVRPLDEVLTELGMAAVDVLRIAADGAEPAVVRGLLRGDLRPSVCLVAGEAPGVGHASGRESVELLVAAGYEHCLFDGLNHYLTTDATLVTPLSVPANPNDGYVTDVVHRLVADQHTLRETVAALAAENLALRGRRSGAAGTEKHRSTGSGTPESTDLPVPSARTLPTESGTSPTTGHVPPVSRLAPGVRLERRKDTFRRLVSGPRQDVVEAAGPRPLNRLLRLVDAELAPADAVALLYREVLGREADVEGLAGWTRNVEAGMNLLDVARALAGSPEAVSHPSETRARVEALLAAWQGLLAAREVGLAGANPQRRIRLGSVSHQIFVEALYEVSLQRTPRHGELELELSKLADGVGREWLLRAFAARPEPRLRILGPRPTGLRGRARRWLDNRHYHATFRAMVVAAEGRLLAQLVSTTPPEVDPTPIAKDQ